MNEIPGPRRKERDARARARNRGRMIWLPITAGLGGLTLSSLLSPGWAQPSNAEPKARQEESAAPERLFEAVGGPEWRRFIDETIEETRARMMNEEMNKETADRIEDGIRALDQIAQGVARVTEAVGASFQSEEFKAFTQRMEKDFKEASDSFQDVDWQGLEDMVRAMAEEVVAPLGIMVDKMEAASAATETLTETRDLSPFHSMDINGSFTVDVEIGVETRLEMTAREEVHPLIRTDVEEGMLRVHASPSGIVRGPIALSLTTPNLDTLVVSGANQITILGLASPHLRVKITGTSNVSLTGEAVAFAATLSGASNLHAGTLVAKTAEVSCAGACNATVQATESLRAAVTGASNIVYLGDPPTVHTEVRGVGSVRPE